MLVGNIRKDINIIINGETLEQVNLSRYIGVYNSFTGKTVGKPSR